MTLRESKLSDLCEIISSKRVFAASYQSEGIPFFRGKEVSQLARGEAITAELYISEEVYEDVISRTGPVKPGHILLTAVGTLGNPYQVKESDLPFYFKDGNIVWLRSFSDDLNPTFLFYWLNSEYGRRKVLDTSIGSTQAALTISALSKIKIGCPSLSQQSGIVEILSAIDGKIAGNRVLSETLEAIAQTIFKSWFIDFDPVKAKMAGEKPAGMNAVTAALFPDTMEKSELGLIPKGWKASILGEVCDIKQGKYLAPAQMSDFPDGDETVPVIGGNGVLGFTSKSTFSFDVPLVTCRGSRCGLLQWANYPSWVSNNAMAITMKASSDYSQFLYLFFKQVSFENVITGSAQPQITITNLNFMKILVPDESILRIFTDITEQMRKSLISLNLENQNLGEIRDSLLPRLISGDLQIPDEMLAS